MTPSEKFSLYQDLIDFVTNNKAMRAETMSG